MEKQVTLIAKTTVAYGGRTYGENMQFVVPDSVATRLIDTKQAEVAPKKLMPKTAETRTLPAVVDATK